MASDAQTDGQWLENHREFLGHLARLRLDPRLRRDFDPEDLVQKTMLAAHAVADQFAQMNERQCKAWLRETFLNQLKNALRDATRLKRDVNRDRSLDDIIENSSLRVEAVLAAEQSSPSERAHRNEMALRLDEAIKELPERQREAVVLKHYHGWTVATISRHMGVTHLAVAGLLHRGLMTLRELLPKPE